MWMNQQQVEFAREDILIEAHVKLTAGKIDKEMREHEQEVRKLEDSKGRARGYYINEMADSSDTNIPRKRFKARREASKKANQSILRERQDRKAVTARQKTSLVNLERAKIAKAKLQEVEEVQRQEMLKRLKKARAAKKRKAKKK